MLGWLVGSSSIICGAENEQRQVGVHMGFPEHEDAIFDWTELNWFAYGVPVSVLVWQTPVFNQSWLDWKNKQKKNTGMNFGKFPLTPLVPLFTSLWMSASSIRARSKNV